MLITNRAENYIFQQKSNHKISYFSDTDEASRWINDNFDKKSGFIRSGGTVTIAAYYFANTMGCNPIAFAGLDLAFIDNMMYANGKDLKVDKDGNILFDLYHKEKTDLCKGR